MVTANKITNVSNRVERAKSLLLSQFKDKPNINALVDALVSELQELEDVITDLQTVRTLEGAYGKWLDDIGEELEVMRGDYADNDYKTAIKIAMARQSVSATVDDILRIVALITGDTTAELRNDSHYLMELYSYFFCVSDSSDGLLNLAKLFPVNTRVRFVKHDVLPFKFNTTGQGFGTGSTLNNLIYVGNGSANDSRFINIPTQSLPPALISAPTFINSPYIYGTSAVGNTLTLVPATYDGDEPITVVNQWLLDGVDISGETGLTYTIVAGDAGKVINVRTTITNDFGTAYTYSNNILIDVDIPATNPLEGDIGLRDFVATEYQPYDGSITSSTASIVITKDGTVNFVDNGATITTDNYLVSPSADAGAGYKVSYQVVSGAELLGLNQNVQYTLSSNLTLSQTVSSKYDALKTGQYRFTIYQISNPDFSVTKTINITAELVREI